MKRTILPKFYNRGFTDKLYFLNLIIVWIFTWSCFILTVFSGFLNITDMSIVSYGIPSAFTELGLHTGFIVWKAKCENINKHNKDKLQDIYEEVMNE